MNLSVNLRTVGNLVKTVISLLSKIFYLCFTLSVQEDTRLKTELSPFEVEESYRDKFCGLQGA